MSIFCEKHGPATIHCSECYEDQLADLQERLRRIEEAAAQVLTGGNHLASALIHWLGAGTGNPPYSATVEEARASIADVNQWDAWVCWKGIMEFRDALRAIDLREQSESERLYGGAPRMDWDSEFFVRIAGGKVQSYHTAACHRLVEFHDCAATPLSGRPLMRARGDGE